MQAIYMTLLCSSAFICQLHTSLLQLELTKNCENYIWGSFRSWYQLFVRLFCPVEFSSCLNSDGGTIPRRRLYNRLLVLLRQCRKNGNSGKEGCGNDVSLFSRKWVICIFLLQVDRDDWRLHHNLIQDATNKTKSYYQTFVVVTLMWKGDD